MLYDNTVPVDPIVYKSLMKFTRGKKPSSDLFEGINASRLNDYLKSMMDNLSAKVFRTYNASITLQNELYKEEIKENENIDAKTKFYNDCNRAVAVLCNHQKAVSKNHQQQIEKME